MSRATPEAEAKRALQEGRRLGLLYSWTGVRSHFEKAEQLFQEAGDPGGSGWSEQRSCQTSGSLALPRSTPRVRVSAFAPEASRVLHPESIQLRKTGPKH